jgi:hypothetical protein
MTSCWGGGGSVLSAAGSPVSISLVVLLGSNQLTLVHVFTARCHHVLASLHERARHGARINAQLLPHVHTISNTHAKHVPVEHKQQQQSMALQLKKPA